MISLEDVKDILEEDLKAFVQNPNYENEERLKSEFSLFNYYPITIRDYKERYTLIKMEEGTQ
jgi:hypothetical protein